MWSIGRDIMVLPSQHCWKSISSLAAKKRIFRTVQKNFRRFGLALDLQKEAGDCGYYG